MSTKVKICGVTRAADGAHAARAGADFIGLNFWPASKRYLTPADAIDVVAAIRDAGTGTQVVGVFVDADADQVAAVMATIDLDIVQLHGAEPPAEVIAIGVAARRPIWKAVSARGSEELGHLDDWTVDAIVLDTPTPGRGGSGKTFDWALAIEAQQRDPSRRIVLAGGLSADNVGNAIAMVAPWAVDVATGVESAPGQKDPARVEAFVAATRAAQSR